MIEELSAHPFTGIFITFFLYLLGRKLYDITGFPLFSPLIFSISTIIGLLLLLDLPYENYNQGGQFIDIWIGPATVALAIKLEENIDYVKDHFVAIISGIFLGTIVHTAVVLGMSILLQLDQELFITIYPKSITTPMAIGIVESMGGIVSLTVALVVYTAVVGALLAPPLVRSLQIDHPVAKGIAMGAGAIVVGTTRAIKCGPVEGAMASVSVILTGVMFVLLAPLIPWLISIFY